MNRLFKWWHLRACAMLACDGVEVPRPAPEFSAIKMPKGGQILLSQISR